MDSHELFVENKFRRIAEIVPPNSKVLDVGCHDGKLNDFLVECDYFGVDVDKNLINNLLKKKIKAKYADLNYGELPFKKEKFDYIFLLDILEHVVNPTMLLADSKKRLHENGRLITTLPNDYHILNKLRFVANKHLTEDPFAPYGHLHYFPIKSGEKFLLNQGFRIIKKEILPPVKPLIIPQKIKNSLARIAPQAFARDILYVLSPA